MILGLGLNDSISGLSHIWLLAVVTLDPDLLGAELKSSLNYVILHDIHRRRGSLRASDSVSG